MDSTAMHHPLSQAVVETVAAAEDTDPLDLEVPLYEVIDPDALDALFGPTDGAPRPEGRIVFEYYGYTVVATGDGTVSLVGEQTASEKSI